MCARISCFCAVINCRLYFGLFACVCDRIFGPSTANLTIFVHVSMDKISVCVRLRPVNEREIAQKGDSSWIWTGNTIGQVSQTGGTVAASTFTFDNVFAPSACTEDLYENVCAPVIQSAIDGINATIFAYGQTSSGKTYAFDCCYLFHVVAGRANSNR
jgi:hypothetical protein